MLVTLQYTIKDCYLDLLAVRPALRTLSPLRRVLERCPLVRGFSYCATLSSLADGLSGLSSAAVCTAIGDDVDVGDSEFWDEGKLRNLRNPQLELIEKAFDDKTIISELDVTILIGVGLVVI